MSEKCQPYAREDRDAGGWSKHAGRWEDRARWKDPSDSEKMPNYGHYAQRVMGREKWEAGGYLNMSKGVHEAGYKVGPYKLNSVSLP